MIIVLTNSIRRLFVLLASLALASPASAQTVILADASVDSQLEFVHQDGSSGKQYLVELMGAGVALLDYDQDGWTDILLCNGAALPGKTLAAAPLDTLFRNNHDGTFTNVTVASHAGDKFYTLGVVCGDVDNDGFDDIYYSNFARKTLLHNNGDGTYSDITETAGVSDADHFGAGAAFLDIEGDGDLDLLAGNYVQFDFASHEKLIGTTFPYPPGPQHYPHTHNTLFRNEGDGTFVDVSQSSGIAAAIGPTMGLVAGDLDQDGDTDVMIGCDAEPNLLLVNDGRGNFREQAFDAGLAYDSTGKPVGSMGVEMGDIDNDGLDDLFITDYSGQLPLMFRNLGKLTFEDVSRSSRAGSETLPHAKWSSGLVDFDNDADRDLFICQGHLLKDAHRIEQLTDFRVRNSLMVNDGRGRFQSATQKAGSGLAIVESTRGAGFDDLDNDGDVDAVLLNCAAPANLLRNDTQSDHHWLQIELHGRTSNRSAVGSNATVTCGSQIQVAEVHAGRSYQSHYGTRLHFGLGSSKVVDRLTIRWHAGEEQVLENVRADQLLVIVQ